MAATERPLSPGTGQRPQQNNHQLQNNLFYSDGQEESNLQKAAIQLLSLGYSVIPTNTDKKVFYLGRDDVAFFAKEVRK